MKILKGVLINNFSIKIIALTLALLTWSYIGGQLYKKLLSEDEEAPSVIKVSGEKLIVKRLPIYVNIEGEPADGYRIAFNKIVISPSYSVVAGASEFVQDLSHIGTETISVAGADNTIRKKVMLKTVPNCKVGYDGDVRVTIPVTRVRRR